jgi:hypothetical protein
MTLCEKYGIDSPKKLVFPQMVYDRSYHSPSYRSYWFSGTVPLDYDRYLNILHRTLDYLDSLYENGEGGIPLQYQGAEVLRRVLQRVADYHGYQSVRTSFSPRPGEVLIRSQESMDFPEIQEATFEEMNSEERANARDFRRSVIGNQGQVIENSAEKESFYENIRQKVQRIQEYKRDTLPLLADWLRRHVAKRVLKSITKRMYMDEKRSRGFIKSNQYIFYPIQYFRESRVTMRAPEFYNQLWLIEYLSRSLPLGYELVVKDHPQQLGALPLSQIRSINNYATTIAPSIPARKVIKHADAIITLNNTVGYEAVMTGKPVLTLGDAFYSGPEFTIDIENINTISKELKKAVMSEGLSDEEVLEFAHGISESSYNGTWGETNLQNIDNFVDSVETFLNN